MSSKLDEACRTNQKIRASFILYEFRYGKSIFKCYNDFCEKMGPNFMDYLEFEFWWMRFSAGNFDIEYDRSKGPKYRTITDLPVDIFENICENLGDNYQNKYRFIFRHVCKSFRALADSWIPKFEKVSIEAHFTSSVDLYFDGKKFHYKNEKKALSDLISVIAHPKFDNFGIDSIMIINPAFLMRLVKELESRKLKIQVHYVHISSYYPDWKNQMPLFSFYQAETVKMVYIKERQEQILEFIEEICELDQEERAGDDGIPENGILKPKSTMFSRMDIALRYLDLKMPCKIPKSAYSDLATIRKFVLYDVLQGLSPYQGFHRLCGTLRKNLIYRKYEYLYYQIYNGNLEPNMPRFFSKSFSDLPMEVLDEIVSYLSAKERLDVRKVGRNLRDVIDQQKPNFNILKMCFDRNQSIILKIDDLDLKFPKDSYEEPLKKLENSLKSSRHVEKFELKLDDSQGSKSLVEMLRDVSSTRLKVGKAKISVENTDEALEILGFFEPGELKKIELEDTISWRHGKAGGNVERFVEMEQFKQAEDVNIREFGVFDSESELLNKFLHLKRMVIKLNVLSKEVALYLKNAILEDSGRRLWYVSSEKELNIHEFEVYLENNGDIPDSDDSLESDDEDPRQRLIRLRNMLEPVCLTEDIPNSEETLTLDIDSTEIIFDRINLNDSIDHSFND